MIEDSLASAMGIKDYLWLLSEVQKNDFVLTDDFKKRYKNYFGIRARSEQWYSKYYDSLQNQKKHPRPFKILIKEMLEVDDKKLDVSYVSKLIAITSPNKPIWDQYVLKNLGLYNQWERRKDKKKFSKEERLEAASSIYDEIEKRYESFLNDEMGKKLINSFDNTFPNYKDKLTDVKKLDFVLWRIREKQ